MSHSILVVDDEMRLADVLAAALEDLGYRATAVHSARAALIELERARFDLVLTDLRLPVMDGRALLREVRSRWPEVPVIIITAFAAVRDAVDLVKEGAFDYIAKPFEIDDVSATIRRALRLADVFRAKVVDTTLTSFIFEITGTSDKVDRFIALMRECGLVEVGRTGVVAIARGAEAV